jgi:hypothetical protein
MEFAEFVSFGAGHYEALGAFFRGEIMSIRAAAVCNVTKQTNKQTPACEPQDPMSIGFRWAPVGNIVVKRTMLCPV